MSGGPGLGPGSEGAWVADPPVLGFDVAGAEGLVDEGRAAMERGDRERALQLFQQAVERGPIPAALNNLALMTLEHRHDPAEALRILQPNLRPDLRQVAGPSAGADVPTHAVPSRDPPSHAGTHPFAHAVAARCHHRLGDTATARRHLEAAIRAFEQGPDATGFAGPRRRWQEYTAAILLAAGTLEDDRLAWELYRRWSGQHVLPQSHYLGGLAAFNLRRFDAACRAWLQAGEQGDSWGFVEEFIEVAKLCDTDLVPPFRLPYATPRMDAVTAELERVKGDDDRTEALVRRVSQDPLQRMLLICTAFDPAPHDPEAARVAMTYLVASNGEWGEKLARAVFMSNRTTISQKMNAARGLMKAGVARPGEKVRMLIDGRAQDVTVRELPVDFGSGQEPLEKRRQALELRRAGKLQEAKELLESLLFEGDRILVLAVALYALLLEEQGNLEEARRYLEMLLELAPNYPVALVNLAALSLQQGELDEAERFLSRVHSGDPEIREAVRTFRRALARLKARG
ncbi:MAG: tetratricopeptide repeat protein [Bacillota bacterium]